MLVEPSFLCKHSDKNELEEEKKDGKTAKEVERISEERSEAIELQSNIEEGREKEMDFNLKYTKNQQF